ncbi:NADH:flavin oxidoreductase/NADH oxidase [Panacibacter ginsenosidivorans]|uniref:NADH:flavin oxidoreductase/NADH oxidase n=1 Tax=Panacibacter ginsenosidivorans TaxID=1813871 RepID=A0A5B8V9M4_9BACT|nr:NADH:flavin oxidoreductase/NADH oxidase [Panacibacter ginsenosidivorans]QEC67845.1 NADH:flavin oxidoreductase/NADH oxidase [Panacibacter ginsenosidivorans]
MAISLFDPFTIRSITLKNRLTVSPMCQYSSIDGFANDWHLVHLGSRAVGGAGLIIMEATAVSPEGRITPDDMGIWKDEHIDFLKRITTFIESQGAVPAIQLAHAGRKASNSAPWKGGVALTSTEGAWQTLAPSAIPFNDKHPAPKAMTNDDIRQLLIDFRNATTRALQAGFKIIEIHAAHGYLINSFLSPLSNQRKDDYGGSFENRIRLLCEITEIIRTVLPKDYPLFVRISATDWVDGGWTIDDSVRLAAILKTKEVDLIDCSSGGNSTAQKIPVGPMYQTVFAERIKKETGILTGAVGMINTTEEAASIIQDEKADLVIMARQMLRDPYFALHAAKELSTDIKWPDQYLRAKR